MAATVFPDITFWQDTPTNRAIAQSATGAGTPEKGFQSIYPPNDSGTTPGILYADTPASARNVAAGSKILMRVGSLAVDSDTRSYPNVRYWRQGNVNTASALTKVAGGNNQLCLIPSTNPSVDVDTLIEPTPTAIGFLITKLNFSDTNPPASTNPGSYTRAFDENPSVNAYVNLNPAIPWNRDQYDSGWWFNSAVGNPYDDGGVFWAPTTTGITYVWFELTPSSALISNVRYRVLHSNSLEFIDLTLNTAPPSFSA